MNRVKWVFAIAVLLVSATGARAQAGKPTDGRTSAQVVDFFVSDGEKKLIGVAEAMPADKYTFAPANGEFTGVRTFAQQVKHFSATNYILAAGILGVDPPADAGDEMGPDSLKTKADILEYLKGSFVYLHKAVATIDEKNARIKTPPISPPQGKATRLGLAIETLLHTYDHYGQLVEYLRMNGIIPPASRL
jgi:hypothetical protein